MQGLHVQQQLIRVGEARRTWHALLLGGPPCLVVEMHCMAELPGHLPDSLDPAVQK